MTDTMDEVMAYAEKLNFGILESDIYKEYMQSRYVLENDKEAYEKYQGFYQVHLAHQLNRAKNLAYSFDEEKYISSLYCEIMLIDSISGYLTNRNRLIHLLNQLYQTMIQNILL